MSRWFVRFVVLALAVAVIALVAETRRLAELAGRFELEAFRAGEAARLQVAQLEQQLQSATAAANAAATAVEQARNAARDAAAGGDAVDLDAYSRLQLELHAAKERVAALTALVAERNAALERRAQVAGERAARALQPIPAGVRRCLESLHTCLRAEGFFQQRFLRASAVDGEGLHDVEMLDARTDGFAVAFVQAERMTASLDRQTGRLELRFFDGHRTADGERAELPDDGWPLSFADIDGRMVEQRLPFLVRAEGSYPTSVDASGRPVTDIDAGTRRQWLRRLERVLGQARTDKVWRVTRLRGMQDGYFLTVEVVATNDKGLVLATGHCERAAIEIDEASGVVSLLLRDGVLRQEGVESTITDQGYRMLLPGLTAKQAIDAMIGMVVKK